MQAFERELHNLRVEMRDLKESNQKLHVMVTKLRNHSICCSSGMFVCNIHKPSFQENAILHRKDDSEDTHTKMKRMPTDEYMKIPQIQEDLQRKKQKEHQLLEEKQKQHQIHQEKQKQYQIQQEKEEQKHYQIQQEKQKQKQCQKQKQKQKRRFVLPNLALPSASTPTVAPDLDYKSKHVTTNDAAVTCLDVLEGNRTHRLIKFFREKEAHTTIPVHTTTSTLVPEAEEKEDVMPPSPPSYEIGVHDDDEVKDVPTQANSESSDLSTLTMLELRALCKRRKLRCFTKFTKKDELIQFMNDHEYSDEIPHHLTRTYLEQLSASELKDICRREPKFKGFSKCKKKQEVVDFILQHQT